MSALADERAVKGLASGVKAGTNCAFDRKHGKTYLSLRKFKLHRGEPLR